MLACTHPAERVGDITITTGTLYIGDPCYTLTADASGAFPDRDALTAALRDRRTAHDVRCASIDFPSGSRGMGVTVDVDNGDYEVQVTRDPESGCVSSLRVILNTQRKVSPFCREYVVGNVAVDAGLMWAGDPAGFVGAGSPAQVATNGEWATFCLLMQDEDGDPVDAAADPIGSGHGACTSTGHGDGYYPVGVVKDSHDGTVLALTVTFIPDDDD